MALLGFQLGKTSVVFGKPDSRIPLNYVENLVGALRLVFNSNEERLQQFNIVDDDALTLRQYHSARKQTENTHTLFLPGSLVFHAASIAQRWTTALTTYQVKRALEDRWYLSARIRREAGWEPELTLKQALERIARHPC